MRLLYAAERRGAVFLASTNFTFRNIRVYDFRRDGIDWSTLKASDPTKKSTPRLELHHVKFHCPYVGTALEISEASAELNNCSFVRCTQTFILMDAKVHMENCLISHNSRRGMACSGSKLFATSSRFVDHGLMTARLKSGFVINGCEFKELFHQQNLYIFPKINHNTYIIVKF